MAAAPTPGRPAVHTPATFLISGFVIETYPAMVQVPFASVSDQRGKAVKTSEHERFDELYGRCRTCMGYKSGEQLLLCDDCDRGFHMTCLVPPLREVPKGEWHCAKCTRDRRHTFHRRATAVATLRRVLDDVGRRPTLPPRLKLKFLDLPAPIVRYTRIPLSTKSVSEQLQNDPLPPDPQVTRHAKTLPPKCRQKQSFTSGTPGEGPEVQEPSTLYSKVTSESIRRSRKHFFRFLGDLTPVVRVRKDTEALKSLQDVRGILSDAPNEFPGDEFVETRTSDNSPSKHAKRARTTAYEDGAMLVQSVSENSNPSRENGITNGAVYDKGSTNSRADANTTSDPAGAQTNDEHKQRTE